MKNYIQAVIISFNPARGSGWVRVSGRKTVVQFKLDAQREFLAGVHEPEFGDKSSAVSFVLQKGAHVVVKLEVERHEEGRGTHFFKQWDTTVITAWNFLTAYKDAMKAIAERPVYQVWEAEFYRGEPVTGKTKELVASGSAPELQAKCPCGGKGDIFAPVVKYLDMETRHWFEVERANGEWAQCEDPRPLPVGVAEPPAPVQPLNRNGGQYLESDAEFIALANGMNGKRNGTKTPRPGSRVYA